MIGTIVWLPHWHHSDTWRTNCVRGGGEEEGGGGRGEGGGGEVRVITHLNILEVST